jgi:hypothetical protein
MVMKGKGVGEKRRRTGKDENAKSFNPLSNESQAERMQRVGKGVKRKNSGMAGVGKEIRF